MPLELKKSAIEVLQAKLGGVPVLLALGFMGVFGLASFSSVDMRNPDVEAAVGLDARVLLKLAFVGANSIFAAYCAVVDQRVRQVFLSLPGLCLVLICTLFLLAAILADQPIFAGVSAVSIATAIAATVSLAVRLGPRNTAVLLWAGVTTFVVASWLVYLFAPHLGVYKEPIAGGEFVSRMAGLAHPNVLGQYCGLAILLAVSLFPMRRRSWTQFGLVLLVLTLGSTALVMSMSRTSLVALILTLLVIFRGEFVKGKRILLVAVAIVVTAAALLVAALATDRLDVAQRRFASSLSKSGEAEEITSATGRTIIWKYTLKLIGERPLIGYGLTSSKALLIDHSSFTHNMILNVALSAGIFTTGALLMLIAIQLLKLLTRPSMVADGLLVFIILNGLTENVIFEYIAAAPTALFALSVTWRVVERVRKV